MYLEILEVALCCWHDSKVYLPVFSRIYPSGLNGFCLEDLGFWCWGCSLCRWYMSLLLDWLYFSCHRLFWAQLTNYTELPSCSEFLWVCRVAWQAEVWRKNYCSCSLTSLPWPPWSRKWQPTAIFLPVEFQGQRSLMDYCPWSCKELQLLSMGSLSYNW